MVTEFERALMNRDGLDEQEAHENLIEAREAVYEVLGQGGSYCEVEEILLEYGLEMDYIMDLI